MGKKWRWLFSATFYLTFFIVASQEANIQTLTKTNLKELLTPTEWTSIFGHGNSDPDFCITNPYYQPLPENHLGKKLIIPALPFGQNFTIELIQNPHLLSPNFLYIETSLNKSSSVRHHNDDINCHYRSEDAALSLCKGVRGILHPYGNKYYIIEPLPDRFQNKNHYPHILIQKNLELYEESYQCSHQNLIGNKTSPKLFSKPSANFVSKKGKAINGKNLKILNRNKRENFAPGAPVFVETAVFVDRDLFDHMKANFPLDTERELIRFVLAMINAVQLLYHDPSLGRPVNFLLKRLEILKDDNPDLVRPPDIDRFLSNFCNWQRTKNPVGDREPLHWDHALILTGLDLYVRGKHGKISTQVVGLAPVAGMCTTTSSCTVNEGRHFESVYVVAHEIGHNLGMRHDGPIADNDCDPTSYIMSPTLGSGKITWSPCSKRYLQKFLDTTQSRCLLDHGSSAGQLDHSAEGALPGERFDANQQCMLKYGRGSKHSSQQPLNDVCRDLHCERERYTWTSHPALEGTSCGPNMWCRGGKCISKKTKTSSSYTGLQNQLLLKYDKVNGGWSDWRQMSECASGCLFGEEGRLRSGSTGITILERKCSGARNQEGGKSCEGRNKKYQACYAEQCLNVPKLTINDYANQICLRAKEVDRDLTGEGLQKIESNAEDACTVWCQKRNGGLKSRGWNFPDGTVCQTHRISSKENSYCISGRCEEFVCDFSGESGFAQLSDYCSINEKEKNELLWRNGIKRKETNNNTKWKSLSGCHFNCITPGSGVRLVKSYEKEGRTSIQLCKTDKYGCGRIKSAFQHASMVCNKYKIRVRRLSGLGMQISPSIEDPDRSCKIACQDGNISHRFYLVNGEDGWFPFGTECSKGGIKEAYCINGKCLEFGSDGTPLSENEFTLPLLSRNKRSVNIMSPKIKVKLQQTDLDEIVKSFNKTILGGLTENRNIFDLDWENPIHINLEISAPALNHKDSYKNSLDII